MLINIYVTNNLLFLMSSYTIWSLSLEISGVQAQIFTLIKLELQGPATQETNHSVALTTAYRVSASKTNEKCEMHSGWVL